MAKQTAPGQSVENKLLRGKRVNRQGVEISTKRRKKRKNTTALGHAQEKEKEKKMWGIV